MASMSAVFERVGSALATACVAAGLASSCASEPQVTIVVTRGADFAITPEFLRFVFLLEAGDPIEAGPFPIAAVPRNAFVEVPPLVSFSVDVIGCTSNLREECEEDGDFVGRGCAGPFSRERDTELEIEVELLNTADGNARCPVQP